MRTTRFAVLAALMTTPGCVPMGDPGATPPTSDAGSAVPQCDDLQVMTMDLSIEGSSGFTTVPSQCWKLTGKLTLTGPAISTLAKLGDLREVTDLEIDSTALTKFDTISPINVTNSILIHHNDQLTDLSNVAPDDQLASITIEYNNALTLTALSQVTLTSGAVTIDNNPKMTGIDLSEASRIEGGLDIHDNALLTSLNLSALESVGAFSITHNAALASLGSLSSLLFVHGDMTVDNNTALDLNTSMSSAISRIDGSLVITNNGSLTGIGQLSHAGSIGVTLTISNNSKLTYCTAEAIGCCVGHASDSITGNQSTSCSSGHPWCWNNNSCPYTF